MLTYAEEPSAHFFMPDESHPHKRTWISFVANKNIWSPRQATVVKKNLALLVNTIAQYEDVAVLVNERDYIEAKRMLNIGSSKFKIELHKQLIDDLWIRDTGPNFVINGLGEKRAIDFNFNGWGDKQFHRNDKKVARKIAELSKVAHKKSRLTLEGGCLEVDGQGTALMTKSSIVNENRNPGMSLQEIETELKELLGLRKIIWLEGVKGHDITDAHIDFYARFVTPGEVVVHRDNYKGSHDYEVSRENIKLLSKATDASGRRLKLHILDAPEQINESLGLDEFAAGYIGYYVCNGAVICQKFGDRKADLEAKRTLQKLFPNRVIEQIAVDGIASGGGSIHCATQQEPEAIKP